VNTRTETEVQNYLDQLRRELAGLPAVEVEEIVQDLEPQLTATATELGDELSTTALASRLGTPAEYAAELRTAMDLPDSGPPRHPTAGPPRAALWVLVTAALAAAVGGYLAWWTPWDGYRYVTPFGLALLVSWLVVGRHPTAAYEIEGLPEVRRVRSALTGTEARRRVVGYLESLRPAWFLVRAALVGFGTMWAARRIGWWPVWPGVVAVPAAVIAVVASHRSLRDRRWLWLTVPLTGWAVGVGAGLVELLPGLL
jgi:hypothetical protein